MNLCGIRNLLALYLLHKIMLREKLYPVPGPSFFKDALFSKSVQVVSCRLITHRKFILDLQYSKNSRRILNQFLNNYNLTFVEIGMSE